MSEYLDRKQVIELYEKHHSHLATYVWEFGQELRQLPIVEERPHGEWYYSCQNGWQCSICQQMVKDMPTVMGKANFNFCPNCGADMRKSGESE